MASKLVRLNTANTALFVCDIQEKFRNIYCYSSVITVAEKMIKACNVLGMPFIVTEQYPKGLGSTVEELQDQLKLAEGCFSKTKFSMLVPDVREILQKKDIKSVLLVGIESHVCVLQTALDLLENNYKVHVLADGVSSHNQSEILLALNRMKAAGATINTSDSALFELVNDAKHDHFRTISGLVKEYMARSEKSDLLKNATASAHL